MQKIIYCNEVMGLSGIWYDLNSQNKELHDEFMTKVLALGYLKDESDLFKEDPDMIDLLMGNSGWLQYGDKFYTFKSGQEMYPMRADVDFHQLVEEYNQKLTKSYILSYKDVPNHRIPSMLIITWDCGSESILFKD